jgi:citrate synthase
MDALHYRMTIFENIKRFMEGFRYDAHPMGMLVSTVAARRDAETLYLSPDR